MNTTVYNKKNKLLIPIIIILLIPTVLAVFFSLNPGSEESIPLNVVGVKVEFEQLGLNQTFSTKEDTDIYKTAVLQADKITAEFRDVSAETPFIVTISTENEEAPMVYEFFMKNDIDECIYRNSEGSYYLLKADDALKLLERTEFMSVNKTAAPPYAFAGTNNIVLAPNSGEWSYVTADGSFTTEPIDGTQINNVPVKINANSLGGISFNTEAAPDSVNVKLTFGGEVKHDGAYENMLNANVMSANDTFYDMVITAVWNQKEEVDYYGTAVYNVQLFYDVSPTYSVIFNGNVIKGDFGIIKIQNFNEGDKITVTSDLELPAELQVFKSPLGYSYAFLPVEYWAQNNSGTYTVTLSLADGSSQNVQIRLKDSPRVTPSVKKQDMLVSDIDVAGRFTEEAFAQFDAIVAEKTAATASTQLWVEKFVYPNSSNSKNRGDGMGDYGTLRTVNAGGLYNNSYYHNGIDFKMADGESVLASNNGKVVFAGELTLTGNTVIIDHGCSVLSYYGHLDTISVSEGDMVNKSAVIGTAGKTGFAVAVSGATAEPATQVHFAVSMEGKFITPYYLWDGGIKFDD